MDEERVRELREGWTRDAKAAQRLNQALFGLLRALGYPLDQASVSDLVRLAEQAVSDLTEQALSAEAPMEPTTRLNGG